MFNCFWDGRKSTAPGKGPLQPAGRCPPQRRLSAQCPGVSSRVVWEGALCKPWLWRLRLGNRADGKFVRGPRCQVSGKSSTIETVTVAGKRSACDGALTAVTTGGIAEDTDTWTKCFPVPGELRLWCFHLPGLGRRESFGAELNHGPRPTDKRIKRELRQMTPPQPHTDTQEFSRSCQQSSKGLRTIKHDFLSKNAIQT